MAGAGKRGGADRVLESRHLVGLFLGVVLLCGVFFTLGYVMGRTQYGGSVHAETLTHRPSREDAATPARAAVPVKSNAGAASPSTVPNEWDFYKNNDDKNTKDQDNSANSDPSTAPTAKPPAENIAPDASAQGGNVDEPEPQPARSAKVIPAKNSAAPSRAAKGTIVLQVAALRHQTDALAMASVLQQKHFPSYVAAPADGDALYRVQVGPYVDERAAEAAKAALDQAGFKAIIKH